MSHLEFKYPLNMIYIVIPIACLALLFLGWRKKEKILKFLKINSGIKFKCLRAVLAFLGLGLMVFSLMGPQTFKGFEEVKRAGLDIYFLIDTSKSMLVQDIKPDRISRVKKIIEGILDNLEGDRVGFIPFSSSAYIQMPLTDDYQLARMFLEVIDTDMIGGGGTNISAAVRLANESFERASSADMVIIVLSDGEEHDTNSPPILNSINDNHLKVFTIGIGSDKGGLIPVYDGTGEHRVDYKKDSSGNFVTSKLNADTLVRLAASGNGSYYQSSLSGSEINLLLNDISTLKRGTFKTEKIKKFRQLYQYFLGVGILLFITAWLLPERREPE